MKKEIVFLVNSPTIYQEIKKKILKKDNVDVVNTTLSKAIEKARDMSENGVKIIITKKAIKLKIQEEINIPIITIENNLSDYIELLHRIDIKNKKILFIDFIEPSESFFKLIKILEKEIYFESFSSENSCKKVVEEAYKKNIDIIIGGSLVKKYVKNYKMEFYDLPFSSESIDLYLDIANQILDDIDNKNIKKETLKNIEILIDNYLSKDIKINNNILDKVEMNDVEKEKLIKSLKENSFSLTNTAQKLGISRTTLWRKLKKYGIKII